MSKNVKEGPLGVFEHPFFCKNEGDPLETLKKFEKRKYHKAEKTCTKNFWSGAGLEPTSFCLADLKKAVTSMPSASRSSVAQLSITASQLIKSVSSLDLKKRAVNAPSQRHIYAQKLQKDFKVSSILFYSTRMKKIEKFSEFFSNIFVGLR